MALSTWGADPFTNVFGGDPFFTTFFDWDTDRGQPRRQQGRAIHIDLFEMDGAYELLADVPGISKESIKLRTDGDTLTITPEAMEKGYDEKMGEGEGGRGVQRVLRSERMTRYAPRSIRLPNDADLGEMKAKYNHGVLKIDIPKKPEAQPRAISIE